MRNLHRGTTVAGQVRALLDDGATGGLTDGELLERFATRGGDAAEAAFAALVERHGPMVLRACRSTLRDPHAAQDAFQSTFLLLARRAGSLWVRDSLAPWLHSVACRTSAGVRAAERRRRALERRAAVRVARSVDEPPRDDLGPALHEEIERLPDRLKAPVVLCYLEGLTHDRAAEHLRCPVGTVRSRLARGRDRLRRALARRGLAPSTTPDEMSLAVAPLPSSLAGLTIQAVRLASDRSAVGLAARWLIFLSEGVFKPMSIHPLKSAAVLLLASGAIAVGFGATSGQDPKPPEDPAPPIAGVARRDRPDAEQRLTDGRFEATEARFEALAAESRFLRLRVEELERRLNAVESSGKATRPIGVAPRTLRKVRPRFENTLVEKLLVGNGQSVKKGDPILEIRSNDLASAKNDCRTKFVRWDHDRKYLVSREPLARDGRITTMVWADTQNDEKKSRLDYLISRDKLAGYGMTVEEIDKLVEGLGDDRKGKGLGVDDIRDSAKMTLTSPIDGQVVQVDAEPGDYYGQKDILMIIAPPKP